MTKRKKQPKPSSGSGVPSRKTRPAAPPTLPGVANSGERICWRFELVDNGGPWALRHATAEQLCGLLDRLREFEKMTVKELFNSDYPGLDYDVDKLPNPKAIRRLEELQLADQTKISRLRLQGKPRLYGFRHENVFHIVFWDPEHEIWPSQKKRT